MLSKFSFAFSFRAIIIQEQLSRITERSHLKKGAKVMTCFAKIIPTTGVCSDHAEQYWSKPRFPIHNTSVWKKGRNLLQPCKDLDMWTSLDVENDTGCFCHQKIFSKSGTFFAWVSSSSTQKHVLFRAALADMLGFVVPFMVDKSAYASSSQLPSCWCWVWVIPKKGIQLGRYEPSDDFKTRVKPLIQSEELA